MTKSKHKTQGAAGAIDQTAVEAFVESDSSFALEMQVLREINKLGFTCQHAGTYEDPLQKKIRQFDIRAVCQKSPFNLLLAVECKQLSVTRPLLVHSVEASPEEKLHQVLVKPAEWGHVYAESISGPGSLYGSLEYIGKKTDQVDPERGRSDRDAFEKISQALNSAERFATETINAVPPPSAFAVIPILVIPRSTLWRVCYDKDGSRSGAPELVSRCPLFVRREMTIPRAIPIQFTVAYLEIITLDAVKAVFGKTFGTHEGALEPLFPRGEATFPLR